MIRPIIQLGHPVLKAMAKAFTEDELRGDHLNQLVEDMAETLAQAGGVGLAAPQVGESVRVILAGSFPTARSPDRPLVPVFPLVNPQVVWRSDETIADWEGCLSFLDFRVKVPRSSEIEVTYRSLDGASHQIKASGFFARVLQHEIDHLDGILTLDRALDPEDIERLEPLEPGA